MSALGRRAYANARVRARRSRLLGIDDAGALRMADGAGSARRTLATLGLEVPDIRVVFEAAFQRVVESYRIVLRSYPVGSDVVRALLRRFEVENIKFVWRALVRHRGPGAWAAFWHELGDLGAVSRVACREVASIGDLVRALERTPYETLARSSLRPRADNPQAAELALDRWTSRQIADAAEALPARQLETTALVRMVVRERDVELLARGASRYGLDPDLVAASTVVLTGEASRESLTRLAAWRPSAGPLHAYLPRALGVGAAGVTDWDDLRLVMRRQRRRACASAFVGAPFRLVTGIALLLFEEEEARALAALVEVPRQADQDRPLGRALAASLMGG